MTCAPRVDEYPRRALRTERQPATASVTASPTTARKSHCRLARATLRGSLTWLESGHGTGRRLATRGAPEDARRLGRVLPRLRVRPALLRGVRGRAAVRVPAVQRGDAGALPGVRRSLQLGIRGRVRGLRRGASAARAVRGADPQDALTDLVRDCPRRRLPH